MKYDNDVLGEPILVWLGICLALRAFVSICWIIPIHKLLETNVKHAPSEYIFYLTFILKSKKKNPTKLVTCRVCDIIHTGTYCQNVHILIHCWIYKNSYIFPLFTGVLLEDVTHGHKCANAYFLSANQKYWWPFS